MPSLFCARGPAFAVAILAGCGVEIGAGSTRMTEQPDAPVPIDAAVDAPPPDARPCTGGDQNVASGGQCYLLFTTPRTWADADAACTAINTRLAVLDTAAKHTVAKTLAGARDTWIGLTDATTETQFRWVDATPFVFTAWDPEEPNNGSGVYEEDFAVIAGARMGDWDDRPGSDQVAGAPAGCCSYAYICQF